LAPLHRSYDDNPERSYAARLRQEALVEMGKESTKKSSDAVLSESEVAEFHERGYLIADFDLD